MPFTTPRLKREAATVEAMIRLYCHTADHPHQDNADLCTECSTLVAYANLRLEKCPFQEGKTTCAKCPVHCYKPEKRAQIRTVMRTAGPQMLAHHPLMTLQHMLDGMRKEPIRPPARAAKRS